VAWRFSAQGGVPSEYIYTMLSTYIHQYTTTALYISSVVYTYMYIMIHITRPCTCTRMYVHKSVHECIKKWDSKYMVNDCMIHNIKD